jgi:hypothetical protein
MPNNSTNNPPLGRPAQPAAIIRSSSDQTPKSPTFTTLVPGTTARTIKLKEPKVPPGQNLAKGLGKITSTINKGINKTRKAVNNFYYGKSTATGNRRLANPLDFGLINLLQLLASVDVCNLITYATNQIPGTKPFDPTDKQGTDTVLGNIKYQIQFAAYTIQSKIDTYYTEFSDSQTALSKTRLGEIIAELKQSIEVLVGPESENIMNNDIVKQAYPSITVFSNYLTNSLSAFDKYSDVRNIPQQDFQKLVSYIDKTREVCVAIQLLNKPTDIIGFADSFLGADLASQLKELDKIIKPEKIVPTIKKIIETCRKVKDVCTKVLQFIDIARFVITIATLLILILKIVSKFLKALPIPNLFTVLGLSTTMSDANGKVIDTADYFTKRLSEISSVLNNLYNLIQDIIIKIENIIQVINLILANLEACKNLDPKLVDELRAVSIELNSTKQQLQDFVDTYDNNKAKKNNTIGEYTIEILTEQLVDEGIELKRRYGIALDRNKIIVVQSTPTFASDDNVIIEEVKLLLRSKNLIKSKATDATVEELSIINEANNYLKEEVSLDSIEDPINFNLDLDDSENEDEDANDDLNLNAFINKLKGGRRLRRRMRVQMSNQRRQLSDSLTSTDPQNRASSETVKKQKKAAFQDEIKGLQELINIYKKEDIPKYTLLLANPATQILGAKLLRDTNKKIKATETRINELKKQLQTI